MSMNLKIPKKKSKFWTFFVYSLHQIQSYSCNHFSSKISHLWLFWRIFDFLKFIQSKNDEYVKQQINEKNPSISFSFCNFWKVKSLSEIKIQFCFTWKIMQQQNMNPNMMRVSSTYSKKNIFLKKISIQNKYLGFWPNLGFFFRVCIQIAIIYFNRD